VPKVYVAVLIIDQCGHHECCGRCGHGHGRRAGSDVGRGGRRLRGRHSCGARPHRRRRSTTTPCGLLHARPAQAGRT